MKRILSALVLANLALPIMASAVAATTTPTSLTWDTFVSRLKIALWMIFGLAALVMFVIAGFEFLTAAGDPEKIGKAKTAVIWGVVGIVAAIIGYSVISIVQYFF